MKGYRISQAIKLIERERNRQIERLGFGAEDDAEYTGQQLRQAAMAYLIPVRHADTPFIWPWSPSSYKPGTYLRNLVKSGALVAAEIDRLLRIEAGQRGAERHSDNG